jgi:hypothetical protein
MKSNDWNCKVHVCSLGLFENEFHFPLVYPVIYLTSNFIPKKYYTCATDHKLNILILCKIENDIKCLTNYVYHATN